jgi:hypothetical protein
MQMAGAVTPSPEDLRRRVEGWRAAERRERSLRREELLEPRAALEAGLDLARLDLADFTLPDPIREREVAAARRTWERLRRSARWRTSDGAPR